MTQTPCLTHFAKDQDNTVTTDASRAEDSAENLYGKTIATVIPTKSIRWQICE